MVETRSESSSDGRKAYQGKYYRSIAPYDDVKRFYLEKLEGHAWVFETEKELSAWGRDRGGRELKWRKGEYDLSIEYAGKANQDWDYAISISWHE
jgi:hypothetical protein